MPGWNVSKARAERDEIAKLTEQRANSKEAVKVSRERGADLERNDADQVCDQRPFTTEPVRCDTEGKSSNGSCRRGMLAGNTVGDMAESSSRKRSVRVIEVVILCVVEALCSPKKVSDSLAKDRQAFAGVYGRLCSVYVPVHGQRHAEEVCT